MRSPRARSTSLIVRPAMSPTARILAGSFGHHEIMTVQSAAVAHRSNIGMPKANASRP